MMVDPQRKMPHDACTVVFSPSPPLATTRKKDEWTNGWMHGWLDGWMERDDGWIDR